MPRPIRIQINRGAIWHNIQTVKRLAPHSKCLAVVKSNAYGLGLQTVLPAMAEADGFGVCQMEEALTLRAMGVTRPIVLLQGFYDVSEIPTFIKHDLTPVCHSHEQLQWLQQVYLEKPFKLWLKYNTGMNRLGFDKASLCKLWPEFVNNPKVNQEKLIMTHLLEADVSSSLRTQEQIVSALSLAEELKCPLSIANSAAIMRHPASHHQWNRPGIMLYGISPFDDKVGTDLGIKPVMSCHSEIIAISDLKKGDSVGYYGKFVCPKDMRVGIVGIGYGDGYPRHASTGTPIMVGGHETQVLGVVSMEMLAVDLSHLNANVGDSVECWGEALPIERVARSANMSPYEMIIHAGKASQLERHVQITDHQPERI